MASERSLKKSRSAIAISDHYVSTARRNRATTGAYSLQRSLSASDLASSYNHDASYVSSKYRTTTYKKYHRDYDLYDDYWWDRRFNTSSLFWPHHCWPNRQHYYQDPNYSLWWNYPSLSHYPKYDRLSYADTMDPVGWRRYRDPSVDQPLCHQYKPWTMHASDPGRTAKMYKQGLISFETVEKNWLVPSFFQRKFDEYNHPYRPSTWYTSPRRYAFTFDSM